MLATPAAPIVAALPVLEAIGENVLGPVFDTVFGAAAGWGPMLSEILRRRG